MWGVSIDYIVQWVSPDLAHFLGYEVDDMLGKDFREFVHTEDMARVAASVEGRFGTCFSQRVRTPSGYQTVKVTTTWVNHNGRRARFSHMALQDPLPEGVPED